MKYLITLFFALNAHAHSSVLTQMSELLYIEGFRYIDAYSDVTDRYKSIRAHELELPIALNINSLLAREIINTDLSVINQENSTEKSECRRYFQNNLPLHLPNFEVFFDRQIKDQKETFEFSGKLTSCTHCQNGHYNLERKYDCIWSAGLGKKKFNQKYFTRENWPEELCLKTVNDLLKIDESTVLIEWKVQVGLSQRPTGPSGKIPICNINLTTAVPAHFSVSTAY